MDKAEHQYETIIRVVQTAAHYTHWPTLLMGILAFATMYAFKRISPKIPNVLAAVTLTTLISWTMGFEHNMRVDITAIESAEAVKLIRDFNRVVEKLPELAQERTFLSNALEDAAKANDAFSVIDFKHDLEVVGTKIERLKHEAHLYRSRLRHLLFAAVPVSKGQVRFVPHPQDGADAEAQHEGRLWRIMVANHPLETDGLVLSGGGAVVGMVPKGLPTLTLPKLNFNIFLQLLPYATIISLLGFMEAISIAKAMAAKTGQRLDPNQELIGQGLANMLGAVGKSYPTSGSFSRSAVNLQSGAISGLSSVFTSLAVIVVLMFFTPLLYHLPQAVLAAVIMMAVIGLVNVSGFIHAWRAQWYDGAISIITFVCTLALAPHLDKGIMIGVLLSLTVFLYKSMRPKVHSLSLHDDEAYRSSHVHRLAQCPYVDLIRFDGPLFFANASYLEEKIDERLMTKKHLRHIIIAANGISDMDASGEETLSLLIDRVRSAGVDISLSGVNESVMDVLKRTHLLEHIGADHVFATMENAVCAVHDRAHVGVDEKDCPLRKGKCAASSLIM